MTRKLLVGLVGLGLSLAILFLVLEVTWDRSAQKKVRQNYERQGVEAIALAARWEIFKENTRAPEGIFQNRNSEMCLKTTPRAIRTLGNSMHLDSRTWPEGIQPNCPDYIVTQNDGHAGSTSSYGPYLPQICRPVIVSGGNGLYFAAALDLGETPQSLMTGALTPNEMSEITQLRSQIAASPFRIYLEAMPYTLDFISFGGHVGVEVTPTAVTKCNGFAIHAFKSTVVDYYALHERLSTHGYIVGLK